MNDFIEDLEAQEVLARHDKRNRYEEIEINGRKMIRQNHSMRYLFTIEQFVKEVEKQYAEKGQAKGIREWVGRDGFMKTKPYSLGKAYYGKLNHWIERYREGTRYSAHVEAFHDASKDLGILGGRKRFWFGEFGDTDVRHDKSYAEWFNEMIVKIHERCQSRKFRERMRLLEIHWQRSIDNVTAFEQKLFCPDTGWARWLVIELTLKYESKYRGSITLDDVIKHRDTFFRSRNYNSMMSCIKAYVWTIEEGEDTGFHLHVVLFCLPVTKDDERLANQIGDYWEDIVTEGRGRYWNNNRADLKPSYERKHGIGVGLIEHSDREMRSSLLVNLLYLAKAEQQLQVRAEGNVHTFGMSGVPKKEKMGRPRKGSVVDFENDGVGQSERVGRESSVVQQGSARAATGPTSRAYKTGVPLLFPIEATVSAV
ncbi:YagK/YfjJ domain-containing protein [Paraburkholderia nodosa]|uniref:inovirus-type Gp2 protein n=1 Tax=Paraburkholderia nodosa TaxID=392320 RepID=UPI00048A1DF1|nr:inovirus-type Gp2 protein [Paraburkholderia nodosa]